MRSFNRCTPFLTQLSSDHLMPEEHKNKFVYLTVNFHGSGLTPVGILEQGIGREHILKIKNVNVNE